MNADFVAAILEEFEGTLDEVIERVVSPALKVDLEILQTRICSPRLTIDPPKRSRGTAQLRSHALSVRGRAQQPANAIPGPGKRRG